MERFRDSIRGVDDSFQFAQLGLLARYRRPSSGGRVVIVIFRMLSLGGRVCLFNDSGVDALMGFLAEAGTKVSHHGGVKKVILPVQGFRQHV